MGAPPTTARGAVSIVQWLRGFFQTGTPQAMTYLVTFMLASAICVLTLALAWNLTRISFGVAGSIAGTITAIGGVIGYVLRRGDDVKEQGQ